MTTSQALSILNHWLHPSDKDTILSPADIPELEQPAKTSSGCAGYQVGTGTILHQQQKLVEQVNDQLNLPPEFQHLFDRKRQNNPRPTQLSLSKEL